MVGLVFIPSTYLCLSGRSVIGIKTEVTRRIRATDSSELSVARQIVDFLGQSLDDPIYRNILQEEPNSPFFQDQYLAEFMLDHFKQRAAINRQINLSAYLEMLQGDAEELS